MNESLLFSLIGNTILIGIGYYIGKKSKKLDKKEYHFTRQGKEYKISKKFFHNSTKNAESFKANWNDTCGFIFSEKKGTICIKNQDDLNSYIDLIKEDNATYYIFNMNQAISI
jgi:hypothetical protein